VKKRFGLSVLHYSIRAYGLSRLFVYSDREVFARLGLLRGEYSNPP